MSEPFIGVILLGVISLCLVTITVSLLVTARDLRRVLKRVDAILPACDQAAQEARRILGEARQLLKRTHKTARHIETVVEQACHVASDVIEQVVSLKGRARTFLAKRLFGNGARADSRRQFRG